MFLPGSMEIMKRIRDYGGKATCRQLSVKYGKSPNFYNTGSSSLAKRIAEKTGCAVMQRNNNNAKWWPILYVGKAAVEEEGACVWKLRDELAEALNRVDLSGVPLYASAAQGDDNPSASVGKKKEEYSKEDFLEEVYMTEKKYERLVNVLLKKKNIILQGAPGVGKTFAAKRLAYRICPIPPELFL